MKKYQRKGFTLLELIIVIALFSIIMFSVVKLLDPVSKFFVRSSNFETTNACVDNMKRTIEGNLKFADRVRLYQGFAPYVYTDTATHGLQESDYKASDDLKLRVQSFYNEFFVSASGGGSRRFLDSAGTIYVLVFDNTQIATDTKLKDYSVLSDIGANSLNSGKIVRYEFEFNNYKGGIDVDSYTPSVWYVNKDLYGNFEYSFSLNGFATESLAELDTTTFDPQDCTISIALNEIKKSPEGLVRGTGEHRTDAASFSMKNVLDATTKYSTPMKDYITIEDVSAAEDSLDRYSTDGIGVDRYKPINTYSEADAFNGFYFIYTMPETTHDIMYYEGDSDPDMSDAAASARKYLDAVKAKYEP